MKSTTHLEKKDRFITDDSARVSIFTGLVISLILMGFFLLLKVIHLHYILSLRAVNFVFLAAGIIYLLRRHNKRNGSDGYLNGLKIGVLVSLYAVIPFAIFMFLYLNMDTEFMTYIQQNAPFGDYLNPASSAAVILVEGTVSGIIFTYIVMPYFKKDS